MKENIRALQSSGFRLHVGDGDWSLFPGMRLLTKIKVPEFQRYDGTTDPRHHLRHCRGKMLPYWDYEKFVIHTFQDSLVGTAIDWYMSLKVADIPTWVDLSSKFVDQCRYCAETPPTLLELNTIEMTENQGFEAYAVKWRARAAKHVPPISETQQIQLFHSTLIEAYYLHLLAHTSSFSSLIDVRKKLDMGIKLGKIEGPTEKEGDASVNAVSLGSQTPQPYSTNLAPALPVAQIHAPPPMLYQQQYSALPINYSAPPAYPSPWAPQPYDHNYAPTPHWASPNRPFALGAPPTAQRAPTLQPQQGGQARPRL
ncbi:hypothetical protein CRG98_039609 [Punica granatum]|uniref:Retrotransposon gag domain-containing protein n=1 Tax=Punica granatum TaxID=22663 RepID=A0A2I0I9A1_PUNGR|nr:hypothetical protein CRG98_039609 [Punica granatum]